MAIPQSGITTTLVGQTIGLGSNDVGTLCTSTKINPWSRYKPGYLTVEPDGTIGFQLPRGMGYNDPRGSYLGRPDEGYNLGDFRGYNHQAKAPYAVARNNMIYDSSQVGNQETVGLSFYIGEIDWAQTESAHNAKQDLKPLPFVNVMASGSSVSGIITSGASVSSVDQNGYVNVPISYTVPQHYLIIEYEFWFGTSLTNNVVRVGNFAGAKSTGKFSILTGGPQLTTMSYDGNVPITANGVTYTDFQISGNQTTYLASGNTLGYRFANTSPFVVHDTNNNSIPYSGVSITGYLTGFASDPDAQYGTGYQPIPLKGNNVDNQITLPTGGSPSTYGDGDLITFVITHVYIDNH
jgi:hypothetical protein